MIIEPNEMNKIGIGAHPAVVLISGGLDSTVALAVALSTHRQVYPLIFDYDQTHFEEITRARMISTEYYKLSNAHCALKLPDMDTALIGSQYRSTAVTRAVEEKQLPPSFVPGRNAVMISVAFGYAYGKKARYIYGGWNAVDYSGYPDCRPSFLHAMELAMQEALDVYDMFIVAPLVLSTKADIIRRGLHLKAPLHLTWSCYASGVRPCGECESCRIRARGFVAAETADPALSTTFPHGMLDRVVDEHGSGGVGDESENS